VGARDRLELPAGKLDEEGEDARQTAERELAEEVGKGASEWEEVMGYFTSPGFTDERITLFHATGLRDVERPEADEEERIEIVPWPLTRLDDAIAECEDAKSLVGLLWLARRLAGSR
jgi:ADP-ribose pyrophosphatase